MRVTTGKLLSSFLFLLLIFIISCKDETVTPAQPNSPVINTSSPTPLEVLHGDLITLRGQYFGENRAADGGVFFKSANDVFPEKSAYEYISWSDTMIQLKVPDTISGGSLYVKIRANDGTALSSNNLNYSMRTKVKLSGKVTGQDGNGLPGVAISVSDSGRTIMTDQNGIYIVHNVALNSAITIKASMTDCSFEPSEYTITAQKDETGLDFKGTMYSSISGYIRLAGGTPVEGVALSYGTNKVYTDQTGKYTLNYIPVGTEVILNPVKAFYTFGDPKSVMVVRGGKEDINFTARRTDGLTITTEYDGNMTFYSLSKYRAIIVKIPQISDYIMQTDLNSIKNVTYIGKNGDYRLVVNASYYDFDTQTKVFSHAGYLKLNNKEIGITKPNDMQIQSLLAYNTKENKAKIFDLKDLDQTGSYDLVFQTGPQIVRNNELDSIAIKNSLNGAVPNFRTAFATVDNKDLYVIITRETATFYQMGHLLLDSGIFYKGELNAVGFDGGPSTILYVKDHDDLGWRIISSVPFCLGVK